MTIFDTSTNLRMKIFNECSPENIYDSNKTPFYILSKSLMIKTLTVIKNAKIFDTYNVKFPPELKKEKS